MVASLQVLLFKNIFEMIKHDMGGLFRIFGMGIVLGIVTSIIMGIIGGSAAISMFVNIGAQAMAIARTQEYFQPEPAWSCRACSSLHAASFRWNQSSWLLAILVTLLASSLCFYAERNRSSTHQFNVPTWGQSE